MKLPFFNVKIADRSQGKAFSAARINIVDRLENQLPLPEGLVSLHFTFSANDSKQSMRFAASLRALGIVIQYPVAASNFKQLICKTLKLDADLEKVKQLITAVADTARKHSYSLDQFRIESESFTPWHGGLVVKAAGVPAGNDL